MQSGNSTDNRTINYEQNSCLNSVTRKPLLDITADNKLNIVLDKITKKESTVSINSIKNSSPSNQSNEWVLNKDHLKIKSPVSNKKRNFLKYKPSVQSTKEEPIFCGKSPKSPITLEQIGCFEARNKFTKKDSTVFINSTKNSRPNEQSNRWVPNKDHLKIKSTGSNKKRKFSKYKPLLQSTTKEAVFCGKSPKISSTRKKTGYFEVNTNHFKLTSPDSSGITNIKKSTIKNLKRSLKKANFVEIENKCGLLSFKDNLNKLLKSTNTNTRVTEEQETFFEFPSKSLRSMKQLTPPENQSSEDTNNSLSHKLPKRKLIFESPSVRSKRSKSYQNSKSTCFLTLKNNSDTSEILSGSNNEYNIENNKESLSPVLDSSQLKNILSLGQQQSSLNQLIEANYLPSSILNSSHSLKNTISKDKRDNNKISILLDTLEIIHPVVESSIMNTETVSISSHNIHKEISEQRSHDQAEQQNLNSLKSDDILMSPNLDSSQIIMPFPEKLKNSNVVLNSENYNERSKSSLDDQVEQQHFNSLKSDDILMSPNLDSSQIIMPFPEKLKNSNVVLNSENYNERSKSSLDDQVEQQHFNSLKSDDILMSPVLDSSKIIMTFTKKLKQSNVSNSGNYDERSQSSINITDSIWKDTSNNKKRKTNLVLSQNSNCPCSPILDSIQLNMNYPKHSKTNTSSVDLNSDKTIVNLCYNVQRPISMLESSKEEETNLKQYQNSDFPMSPILDSSQFKVKYLKKSKEQSNAKDTNPGRYVRTLFMNSTYVPEPFLTPSIDQVEETNSISSQDSDVLMSPVLKYDEKPVVSVLEYEKKAKRNVKCKHKNSKGTTFMKLKNENFNTTKANTSQNILEPISTLSCNNQTIPKQLKQDLNSSQNTTYSLSPVLDASENKMNLKALSNKRLTLGSCRKSEQRLSQNLILPLSPILNCSLLKMDFKDKPREDALNFYSSIEKPVSDLSYIIEPVPKLKSEEASFAPVFNKTPTSNLVSMKCKTVFSSETYNEESFFVVNTSEKDIQLSPSLGFSNCSKNMSNELKSSEENFDKDCDRNCPSVDPNPMSPILFCEIEMKTQEKQLSDQTTINKVKNKKNIDSDKQYTQASQTTKTFQVQSRHASQSPITGQGTKTDTSEVESRLKDKILHNDEDCKVLSRTPMLGSGFELVESTPEDEGKKYLVRYSKIVNNSSFKNKCLFPSNKEEELIPSPSFGSDLDLRQFPLNLSNLCEQSPEPVQNNKETSNSPVSFLFVDKKTKTSSNINKDKTIQQTKLIISPKCSSQKPIIHQIEETKDVVKSYNDDKNELNQKKIKEEYETVKDNQINKKCVIKNLSLYYETSVSEFGSDNVIPLHAVHKRIGSVEEEIDKMERKSEDCNLSGIEKLSDSSSEDSNIVKGGHVCEERSVDVTNQNSITTGGNNGTKSFLKSVYRQNQQNTSWRNQLDSFQTDTDVIIEEFNDRSPLTKNSKEIDGNQLNSITINLNCNLENSNGKNSDTTTNTNDVLQNQDLKEITPGDDISSEESTCEVEIEEDMSQASARSTCFKIESTTSPTKSSENTQNEGSGTFSFPPPLEVPVTKSQACVLDSACKRRAKVKKGSLVDRLRRLVRSERAAVNMFHHEGVTRVSSRSCTLQVDFVVTSCSRLVLNCHYVDAFLNCSEEFNTGEEAVNPKVRVFVDPSYVRNVTPGSILLVHPPWHSVWLDRQGVVLMYGVTKVQRVSGGRPPPLIGVPTITTRLEHQFHCQHQEENCGCRQELMGQLFNLEQSQTAVKNNSWVEGSVMAALAGGRYPHQVRLRLRVLHRFFVKSSNKQALPRMLCVDGNGHICLLKLRSSVDDQKVTELLGESYSNTVLLHKLIICKRVHIDRCKGLRSMLSQLHENSADQQVMYVVGPSSEQLTVQLDPDVTLPCCQPREMLTLGDIQETDGRVRAVLCVMALRSDQLFVWHKDTDSYLKINVLPSAVLPSFGAQATLDISYLWAFNGELTVDRFSAVTVVDGDTENPSVSVPALTLDSAEGDLVLLDSVVSKVSSDVYLRWTGDCGHSLLRVQQAGLFFCSTCSQVFSSDSCHQQVVLEVCVAVANLDVPVRVKVKSETAKILLLGETGHVSSNKSYNMIGVIGSSLKCLALVLEVLKSSLGDIIEIILEEL